MPYYRVQQEVDAYVYYKTVVEAEHQEDAIEQAKEKSGDEWVYSITNTFDDRSYSVEEEIDEAEYTTFDPAVDGGVDGPDEMIALLQRRIDEYRGQFEQLKAVMRVISDHAESYAADWRSGLADGTYDKSDGLAALEQALVDAERMVGDA